MKRKKGGVKAIVMIMVNIFIYLSNGIYFFIIIQNKKYNSNFFFIYFIQKKRCLFYSKKSF